MDAGEVCDAGVDARAGVGSFAGGGVGRFDSGTQLAKYLSNSSSVMSLLMESAGEKSILNACFFLSFSNSWRCCCWCCYNGGMAGVGNV